MKRCYIVGAAATPLPVPPEPGDFIIAADGGYATLRQHGIQPNLLLGDFDSLGSVPSGVAVIQHPVEKDDTDTALAVQEGLARGCDAFVIDGCLGGLLDHTLANLSLLAWLTEQGAVGYLLDGQLAVTALHNGQLRFPASVAGRVSVFSHSDESMDVTLEGLFYPLRHARLTRQVALGVSNEFTGVPASIRVGQGTLLIVSDRKNFSFFFDQSKKM